MKQKVNCQDKNRKVSNNAFLNKKPAFFLTQQNKSKKYMNNLS